MTHRESAPAVEPEEPLNDDTVDEVAGGKIAFTATGTVIR